jgi:hypothetical protein
MILLIRPQNTSGRAGRFGYALAVHMSVIPRSPGNRDTACGASLPRVFNGRINLLQIPFPLKLTSDPTRFHRRIEVKGIGHASIG